MTNTAHHLTAHWVEDGTSHHLTEVWLDQEEAPVTLPKTQDLDESGAGSF